MAHSTPPRFVLCIAGNGDELSVVKGRMYRLLPAEPNDPDSMVRVVDEEGEDYLYPSDWFEAVVLSERAVAALEAA